MRSVRRDRSWVKPPGLSCNGKCMNLRQLPNLISLLRMLLTLPIAWYLYVGNYGLALVLLAIAGLSDVLDGFLVRRYGWATALGAWLDPAADKLLMLAIYLAATLAGLLPLWLLLLVVGRDAWLSLGSLAYRHWVGPLQIEPLWISKVNTLFQILLILVVMVAAGIVTVAPLWMDALILLVSCTTLTSGIAYTVVWGRRARRHWQTCRPSSTRPPHGSEPS